MTTVTAGGFEEVPLDAQSVHDAHGDFVWDSLQRLGARDAELEDMFQEVFIVVHRGVGRFEGRSKLTTWLFGVCVRVVAAHRRRAWFRRERPAPDVDDLREARASDPGIMPDEALARAEGRRRLSAILDSMDLERRAVFVMAEVEEMPADEIAEVLDVPLGTVYSRLHAARKQFDQALKRLEAREAHQGAR